MVDLMQLVPNGVVFRRIAQELPDRSRRASQYSLQYSAFSVTSTDRFSMQTEHPSGFTSDMAHLQSNGYRQKPDASIAVSPLYVAVIHGYPPVRLTKSAGLAVEPERLKIKVAFRLECPAPTGSGHWTQISVLFGIRPRRPQASSEFAVDSKAVGSCQKSVFFNRTGVG